MSALNIVAGVHYGAVGLAIVLVWLEVLRRVPRKFECTCPVFPRYRPHWNNTGQFLEFLFPLIATITEVLLVGLSADAARFVFLGMGVVWAFATYKAYLCWRKHNKNNHKKLKDKVLGRVKVTLSGLKVVPVAVGTASLVVALAGCGTVSDGSEPAGPPTVEAKPPDQGYITQVNQQVVYPNGVIKTVPCLVYTGYKLGGMSCDWDNAKAN